MFKSIKNLKIFLIVLFLLIIATTIGCKKEEVTEEIKKIDLFNGAIAIENTNKYDIYNKINDNYEKIDTKYIISSYNLESKNFIFNENGNIKANYNGKEIDIEEDKNIISPKLSLNGEYLLYFIKDEYLKLKVKKLSNNEYVDFESNVMISGDLVEWLNEDALVYYGVDTSKNNGVFLYDFKEKKEKLLYKLNSGFLEYMKVFDNLIIFTQDNFSKQKSIKIINKDGEVIDEVNEVEDVKDIEYTKEGLFILGKFKDNNYSIYKYKDNELKRIVYDFPKIVNLEKGLSKDSNDNILFVGNNEINEENIYIYKEGSITLVDTIDGNYYFIDIK